jgi:DNA-binding XRE family transcriptional regulator
MTGPEFRTFRKRLGLTQAQLAKNLGISVSQLVNYEKGCDRRTKAPCPVPRFIELALKTAEASQR